MLENTFLVCSSSEEPGEVKAFFVLRFRAVGKFLGKLIDTFGAGNVSAAGKFYEFKTNSKRLLLKYNVGFYMHIAIS